MNAATLRLTGIVTERPAAEPIHQDLRELIAENDRLIERNATLEQQHKEPSELYRELREALVENGRLIERNRVLKRQRDDALTKVAELVAGAAPAPLQPILELGRLNLNYDLRLLSLDGQTVPLTKRGLGIVAYLMVRPDRVIQTATLALALGHTDEDAVRMLIYRVRERLAVIGAGAYLRSHGRSWSGGGYWMSAKCEQGGQP